MARGLETLPPGPDARDIARPAALPAVRRPLSAIVCVDGTVAARALPDLATALVGRSDVSDVVLDHPSVSRRHAVLHLDEPMSVEDLGSTHGTNLNGRRLVPGERAPLAPGMVVELGRVTLLLQYGNLAVASPRPDSAKPPQAAGRPLTPLLVRDPTMIELYRLLDVVAPSTMPVLVLGETGVGKELFAENIHARSPRRAGAFMKLNCAALPETILESELFGHERGAFSGAVQTKIGLFEAASGGTVFLDEVGELSLSIQAKLLRALETREILRVGSTKPRAIDMRFISATNRDLRALVAAGAFRADLFFRLNGISFTLPPLRKRPADVEALVEHFLGEASARLGRPVRLRADAAAAIEAHRWPGNVRELRNVLERASLVSADGILVPDHLGLEHGGMAPGSSTLPPPAAHAATPQVQVVDVPATELVDAGRFRDQVADLERQRIVRALQEVGGNQHEAARLLGMSRRTLVNRLDALAIPRPRKGKQGKPKKAGQPE